MANLVYINRTVYSLLIIGIVSFLVIDVGADRLRLTSAGGMIFLVLVVYFTSTNPAKVNMLLHLNLYFQTNLNTLLN